MEFSLGYIQNNEQLILRSFDSNQALVVGSKVIGLDELKNINIQGLIYDQSIPEINILGHLEGETRFYPIKSNQDLKVTKENFETMSFDQVFPLFSKIRENWILQNNITLVEEIFKTRTHLQALLPNDRSGFFEELWFILRSNLGANNLKLIYNDLIKSKNENEKNKLVKVKVVGNRLPELVSCDEMDETILKHYEKEFGNIFEITDYNKEKGQIVICANIKKSPVLIMANVYQLTRLQKSVLVSLFEGINQQ